MVSRLSSALSSFSLPLPRILSYNIRSSSYYATDTRALFRRRSLSNALISFIADHDIICLQETHLAFDECYAFDSPFCTVSRNNKNIARAGTVIVDTPSLSNFYTAADVVLPAIACGYVQLRRYSPRFSSHTPFQLFNIYFKSGDFTFNRNIINAISSFPNNVPSFVCGDFNFIENISDSSSTSPSLPPVDFLNAWNKFKIHFNLFDPTHDTHTFYHICEDLKYTWTSRIDRFLLPLSLFNNPLITPTISIP